MDELRLELNRTCEQHGLWIGGRSLTQTMIAAGLLIQKGLPAAAWQRHFRWRAGTRTLLAYECGVAVIGRALVADARAHAVAPQMLLWRAGDGPGVGRAA
jgi:hypothetical protein